MPADPSVPLRLLVGIGLRLAIRSFCATIHSGEAAPKIAFDLGETGLRSDNGPNTADVLLADDIAVARNLGRPDAPVVPFGCDTLMAASRPEVRLNTSNFLSRLLGEPIRIALVIPGASAGGGMADRFWERCEQDTPGAGQTLRDKARVVSGSQSLPWGPRQVMELLRGGEADVALGPRSILRSLSAVADLVAPPPALAVEVACGAAILATEPQRRQAAERFVSALLSEPGQAVLNRHGFASASRAAAMV